MARELEGKELDDTVRQWLQSQSPEVQFVDDRSQSGEYLRADFLVLQPFPMAILTMVSRDHQNARAKAKRLLGQRIALAERFGAHLPVVVVVPKRKAAAVLPLADAILGADELPGIQEVKLRIQPSPEVEEVLREGEPGEVMFSTQEVASVRWSDAWTLEDLVAEKVQVQVDSLANRLHQAMMHAKKDSITPETRSAPQRQARASRNSTRDLAPWTNPTSSEWWVSSIRWSDAFDQVLSSFITEACGGRVETMRYREQLFQGTLTRHVWTTPHGGSVIIRRLTVSSAMLSHKVDELIAEAWMTRAFVKPRLLGQVLLLGETGREAEFSATSQSLRVHHRKTSPGIRHINALEAAGWRVAPWDFGKCEPHFVEILKELSNGQR